MSRSMRQKVGRVRLRRWAKTVFRLEPLQRVAAGQRGLHRERHVRGRQRHAQLGEQRLQLGVGALVEHEKTRVHGERHFAGQIDIHRVGVAAKVRARLEQRDLRAMAQGPGRPEA
jgi:hypothetical protein